MNNTKRFSIYAKHKSGYCAPRMIVDASDFDNAIKIGSQRTRLSDFPESWEIRGHEIKRNN